MAETGFRGSEVPATLAEMSSLIFQTEEQQVFVATDTWAVTRDGMPITFTSKALILPHLRMIVAGTGSGGFLDQWFVYINSRMRGARN